MKKMMIKLDTKIKWNKIFKNKIFLKNNLKIKLEAKRKIIKKNKEQNWCKYKLLDTFNFF